MSSDPDLLLNRLVVAALTVFVTVSLFLAAFVFREIWLQQQITELSTDLQINFDDLKQTTEEIQNDLSDLLVTTDTTQKMESLDEVTELLADVDEQLTSLEQDIGTVVDILEPVAVEPFDETLMTEESPPSINRVGRVFTIFVVLTSIAAIAIAIFLDIALRVHARTLNQERL